jgi:flavorubredoxin
MKTKELKPGIYWVGGIDWDLRDFHGYLTQRGSTYNSYLIIDEKITLVDNVKYYMYDEMIARISEIIDPSKIDIIIQNHIEMDHSGSLPALMEKCPNAKIYATAKGIYGLKRHYKQKWNFVEVNNGDTLNIGKRNLQFVPTPMVHWPDNMITYCPEEKLLFSNDSFGQHIASSERIDEEYPFSILMEETKKYYANIVMPYGKMVQKELAIASKLDIEMVCPSHGLIWKKYIKEAVEEYTKWANNATEEKALIIYDTMWKTTEKIAYKIQEAFEESFVKTKMLNLKVNHISDVMTEVLTAKYICVGSPTLNNNMLSSVAGFLSYFKGLAPKGRIGLAFGSYGWGGQSIGFIDDDLKKCGFTTLEKIRIEYIPDDDEMQMMKANLMRQIQKLDK